MQSNDTLYANNLPLQLSSFIGRERELEQLRQLVWSTRLLTLTGPGGCGKTRLAIRLAEQLLDTFRDGVWFVDLAPLPETGLISQAVSAVFALHETTGRAFSAVLVDFLRPREMLIILDNCEHVLPACAELAIALLRSCPNLFILATSREALNVDGETIWPTPPLSVLDPAQGINMALLSASESARLFIDRAVAVQPGFHASEANAQAIAQICQQLDGLPLSIELAAARIRALPVEEVAARMDDRFNLLNLGRRTAPARHQTLRAMIDWSYGLLSTNEKKLFRCLAVFAGGWTIDAAVSICSDSGTVLLDEGERIETLDALSRLVEKSLVTLDHPRSEARYHFLATIRAYAREKLLRENPAWSGEALETRDRHLEYFCGWAETAEASLNRNNQLGLLAQYDTEFENLRAAMEWSLVSEGKVELGLRLAASLGWYWQMRGYAREGRDRFAALLEKQTADVHPAVRAKALYIASGLAFVQTDYPATRALVEESLSIYRELGAAGRHGLANALIRLGDTWRELGNYETAASLLEEGLCLMRELSDSYGIVQALWQLGYNSLSSGADRQAETYFAEALPLSRHEIDQSVTAVILSGLAEVAVRQGDFQRAATFEEESLMLRKQVGEKWGMAVSFGNFAWIAIHQGDYEKAETLLLESLALRREIQDWGGVAWCLEKLAKINLLNGKKTPQQPATADFQRAVWLLGAAAALRAPVGSVIDQADQPEYDRDLDALRKTLGEAAFSEHWQMGGHTPLDEVLDAALPEPAKTSEQHEKEKSIGLTARERTVAALIAKSKSNREIAEALTVEVKTVEAHITHIFNKLGFDSRVQIAVWAVEKGLAHPAQT